MATIDKLDLSVYRLYAVRTQMLEQVNKELRLGEASTIPPQTLIVDNYPKMTELDLLLGVAPVVTPWAYFYPPNQFSNIRRSPFAFFRIAPTFGSLEEQDSLEAKVSSVSTNTQEEKDEKAAISGCLEQIGRINNWMSFIVGRIGQFLQG